MKNIFTLPQNSQCKNCHKTFKIYPEDKGFYNKIEVPEPLQCPDCRRQRRLAWRNERFLYSRQCDLCKKNIISNFSKNKLNKIYCYDCYWSDKWDAMQYGRNFDFSRNFFEQFNDLILDTPMIAILVANSENCQYANHAWECKDCYVSFDMGKCENVYYSATMYHSKDCFDCLNCYENCELCYECVNCRTCYGSQYCYNSENLTECFYCYNCSGLSNCLFCFNLKNKEYCIFNKQYSKEKYTKEIKKYITSRYKERSVAKKLFLKHKLKTPHCFSKNLNCQDCSGNYLRNCKKCSHAFNVFGCENAKYIYNGADPGGKDFYDDDLSGWGAELSYETLGIPIPNRSKFLVSAGYPVEVDYAIMGKNCKNCFGVFGLSKKQYCILNKQYSQQEYFQLREKIIKHMKKTGEWGEFFPIEYSFFGYNESLANDIFIQKKEDVISRGWKWQEEDKNKHVSLQKKNSRKCKKCEKIFKLINQELNFYQKANLPQPKYCFNCRHLNRMKILNHYQLWHRQCMRPGCFNTFETSYSPESKELVYCGECYNREIY